MKLWLKTVICITLVFIITVSSIFSGIIQVRKAEASFVPFIVENAEWLVAILAGFGISFATQSDALAGVHDFAYNLDQTAYNSLQSYINTQKVLSTPRLYLQDLVSNNILDPIKLYATSLVARFVNDILEVNYLTENPLDYTVEGNFKKYTWNLASPIVFTLTIPDTDIPNSVVICNYWDNSRIIVNTKKEIVNATGQKTGHSGAGTYKIEFRKHAQYDWLTILINGQAYTNHTFSSTQVGILDDINWVDSIGSTIPISWLLDKNIGGIGIDENIGALPLPSDGISSPWDNTVIVPPSSISEGVRLNPQDVLQQPAIDNFNNPVLDGVGNPVYQPVPQTWPNTQNPAYPPWPLTPDIEGVAEGTGVIGGILENIRDWVGDIGTYLTVDLPRILTTDLPLAIENIFNGPPPGEEDNNDVTDKMNDFKLPDLFLLFLGVILACIRLMIRFITFLASLLLRGPDGSIIPDGMKQSLNFLKNWNIGLPISFYTLFSSLMTFFFGLRMIKYIKIFVANVHGGITQTYDPREFNDNEVYNEWSKSGHKTEYGDYRKVYDTWKESNSTIPWKGYIKQEAKRRKW